MTDPTIVRLRSLVAAGLAELEARRQEVNDLNVFPVADGDTGDNMALTMRAVLDELDRLSATDQLLDEIGRDQIVESVGRAALLGARGNSGVILSQLIRGAVEELIARPGELVGPTMLAAGMARASERAYGSVRQPAEGTMLTVSREMAGRIASEVATLDEPRVAPGTAQDEQDRRIADLLELALETGRESVKRGPQLLPALKEAGVVDSGAHAITIILSGMLGQLRGQPPAEIDRYAAPARSHLPEHESETFRYCTNFAVTGQDLDVAAWRDVLEAHGDSLLVVGDRHTIKIHIHTDDPEGTQGLFDEVGTVSNVDIADMYAQVEERAARLEHQGPAAACGVVAVHSGSGAGLFFRGEGAATVDGGPTMNPSTADILAAIHASPADEVVVLPNSPNVVMAAERAAGLSDKPASVIRTRSQAEGISVLAVLDPDATAAGNAAAGTEHLESLHSGGIAPAAKDDAAGRFRKGDTLGYVGDELVAWGEPGPTVGATLAALSADGAELVTCLVGAGAPLDEGGLRQLVPGGVDLEVFDGGQQAWWWLLAAE
ncbi:MAG: DAK2 domain-containing protein [Solirubrobacteraceae bacterium]|nr:DAK2 domain-containing protein [Solirubrobacteraceae bacterium]